MNDHLKIELVTLDLKDKNISVVFHKRLEKNFIISPKMTTLLDINQDIISSLFPPIFLRKAQTYSLVGRYWVYSTYLAKRKTLITAVIIQDDKLISSIQQYEHMDKHILKTLTHSTEALPPTPKRGKERPITGRYKSRKSISIAKSIENGRVCPYHSNNRFHALSTPRTKSQPDKDGLIHIKCINRSKGCDFEGTVTAYELSLLKKRDYPTENWLVEVPDSLCPKCNKHPLFMRIRLRDSTTIEKFITCRNYYSLDNNCDYIKS